ncbi:ArxC, integral transmembrane NrfD-like protein (plasmid) [Cereibacter azotoformans]|uniref:NrfD/PsrC family molybdoenzyme membrane anchor subunit n=1 Tax=Cereibacter azotoformans TaxID=43057 RepID=UPI001EEAB2E6|nr:NrfD/PsrC family molybdoenzyme membrane anchor subunit [Cereibacter azotoformans]ULB12475.1 ArxC, integral transmembrane NrfD-like protein [Cereibacter azotoformans]
MAMLSDAPTTLVPPANETAVPARRASGHWPLHLAAALALAVLCGGFALSQLGAQGHAAFNTTNKGVFWGFPIVVYDYFLLTSTGLAMVAGLYHVLGIEAFRPVARRALWLALAGLVGGVAVLFLELGNPWIAPFAILGNLQVQSPLFWKVLLVLGFTISLLVTLAGTIGRRNDRRNPLVILVAGFAMAVTLVAGSVYGMMAMRPMWFGGAVPVTFLIEALVGALAFVMFFSHLAHGFDASRMSAELKSLFTGPLAFLFTALIALHLIFMVGRAATGLWSNAEGLQVWQHLAASPLFHLAIWGGAVIPLALMLWPVTRANPLAQVGAGLLVMNGLLISRYEFIIGGQLAPLFKGSWVPGLIDYVPSATELALLGLAVGLSNAIYAFAAWKLGGEDRA